MTDKKHNPTPKVKPLVWIDLYANGSRYEVSNDNPLGYETSITLRADGGYNISNGSYAPDLDSAKAAAQSDYERRILSALETETDT